MPEPALEEPALEARWPERGFGPLPHLSSHPRPHARPYARTGAQHTRYAQSNGDVREVFPSQEVEEVLGQSGLRAPCRQCPLGASASASTSSTPASASYSRTGERRNSGSTGDIRPPSTHPVPLLAPTAITWSHAADACRTSQVLHSSPPSSSQSSTRTSSSGSFCIQTPRLQAGSIDWGSSQNAGPLAARKDGVSLELSCNNSIDMLPTTPNDQASFANFLMPKHNLSTPVCDFSSKQSNQMRNLSRLACESGAISEADDDDSISRSSTPLSHPSLFGNFSMNIHPELRRSSLLLAHDSEHEKPSQYPASRVAAPVAIRPNPFRRSKSAGGGRAERTKVVDYPPVPALPKLPPHGASGAHRPSTTPRPPTPPRRTHTRSSSDGRRSEGEIASMTGAASVAVRRRVRSSPKSPTINSFGARLNTHRRAASHGGEQLLRRPAAAPLSKPQPPHGLSPVSKTPIAFVISRRAPPPPPIAVTHKRMRSPSPPCRRARALPTPQPKPLPKLPGPAPTRRLPAIPNTRSAAAPKYPAVAQTVAPPSSVSTSGGGPPAGLAPLTIPPLASTPISLDMSPLTPLSPMRSPALGPGSAYARFCARSRAKSVSASRPSVFEPEVMPPSGALEPLAETIAAIKEAETWEWPVPPYVLRSAPELRRPSASSDPMAMEDVEELDSTFASPALPDRALHEPLPPLPMPAPIALPTRPARRLRIDASAPPCPARPSRASSRTTHRRAELVPRRGSESDHSVEVHSGSSFASELGPQTPDDYENPFEHPGLQLLRHEQGMTKSPSAPTLAAAGAGIAAPTSFHYHDREHELAPPTRPRTSSARPRFGVPF